MSTAAQDEFNALASRENDHTTHPEDAGISDNSSEPASDQERIVADSSDEDRNTTRGRGRTAPTDMYHIPRGTHFDANTGPKGVIADAKSFDRARKRTIRQTIYDAISTGATSNVFEKRRPNSSRTREKSSSPDLSASDDDENFMKTWRQNRIHEMQSGTQENRKRRLSPSQRRYGRLMSVDANGYLDAVEKVALNTTVVVCIYDEESAISGIVEDGLANLARKYEFTRFVKLPYHEAEMDLAAVPAILAYRGGEIIANLVSVIDEIPAGRHLSAASLESVLQRNKVLC